MLIDNDRFKQLLISWPEKAIALLYDNYCLRMRNAAEWHTHNQRQAEDIVQEIFADLWKNRKHIAVMENLLIEPYLFTAVRNKCITIGVQNKRDNEKLQLYLYEAEILHEQGKDVAEEKEKKIWEAIESFPRSERECLTLKYKHDMSNEAIALHQAVTVKAVERSITSAYKRLRQHKDIGN